LGFYSFRADAWSQSARASGPHKDEAQIRGNLSFEAAAEEPFRPVAEVVLLRSEAEQEAQLRIPEVAAEVHLGLPVVGEHQQ
jgi:hypothetical protein